MNYFIRRIIRKILIKNKKLFFSIAIIIFGYMALSSVSDEFLNKIINDQIVESDKVEVTAKNEKNDISVINNNIPFFTEEENKNITPFEYYSELDEFGRCGYAYANICKELMPTEERQEIGHIKPSGWKQAKYDIIDSNPGYLYNRCHLIAFCLAGENDNEKNLITGTRYFNVDLMLPYETLVAKYIDENPNNHVLYKVTPVFNGNNLVASGVYMEAWSVEDNGKLHFNVFAPNVQPGIIIDYATGDSQKE